MKQDIQIGVRGYKICIPGSDMGPTLVANLLKNLTFRQQKLLELDILAAESRIRRLRSGPSRDSLRPGPSRAGTKIKLLRLSGRKTEFSRTEKQYVAFFKRSGCRFAFSVWDVLRVCCKCLPLQSLASEPLPEIARIIRLKRLDAFYFPAGYSL